MKNKGAQTFGGLTHDWFVLRLAEVLPKRFVLLFVVPFAYREDKFSQKNGNHSPHTQLRHQESYYDVYCSYSALQERRMLYILAWVCLIIPPFPATVKILMQTRLSGFSYVFSLSQGIGKC